MKVVWIANPTEIECDILLDCELADIECEVWSTLPGPHDLTTSPFRHYLPEDHVARIRSAGADLVVCRYPTWATDELRAEGGPIVAWASEQGPTRNWADAAMKGFHHQAENNRADAERTGRLYMPVGCALHDPSPRGRIADVVADGGPHYDCTGCGGTIKRESVDTMVLPLVGGSLSVYGPWLGENNVHGWSGVPGIAPHYKGVYSPQSAHEIYAAHRIYAGISWNWQHSGYGIKLARAMASGIGVVWHRTPDMALDGLVEGETLRCSSSPKETLAMVREPSLGARGRQWALANWRWSDLLRRLASEIS